MDVTQIPFNRFIKIRKSSTDHDELELSFNDNLKNHIGTFHASAQFALAEACSGFSLLKNFPHLVDSVIPVLRESEVKFKKPAQKDIYAKANISREAKEKFKQQFKLKKRAIIIVSVKVFDKNDSITMIGSYKWFVQKL